MLGWFQAMMPKEERFFELFVRHATIVVAGAEALRGPQRGAQKPVWVMARGPYLVRYRGATSEPAG